MLIKIMYETQSLKPIIFSIFIKITKTEIKYLYIVK